MKKNKSFKPEKSLRRSRLIKFFGKLSTYKAQFESWRLKNFRSRPQGTKEQLSRQDILKSMTNWQHNKAGKACKGSFNTMPIEQMKKFASMPHWKNKGVA